MVRPGNRGDEQEGEGGDHLGVDKQVLLAQSLDKPRRECNNQEGGGDPRNIDGQPIGVHGLGRRIHALNGALDRAIRLVISAHAEVAARAHIEQFRAEELYECVPAEGCGEESGSDCGKESRGNLLPFLAHEEVEQHRQWGNFDSGGQANQDTLGQEALARNEIEDYECHDHDVDLCKAVIEVNRLKAQYNCPRDGGNGQEELRLL